MTAPCAPCRGCGVEKPVDRYCVASEECARRTDRAIEAADREHERRRAA